MSIQMLIDNPKRLKQNTQKQCTHKFLCKSNEKITNATKRLHKMGFYEWALLEGKNQKSTKNAHIFLC